MLEPGGTKAEMIPRGRRGRGKGPPGHGQPPAKTHHLSLLIWSPKPGVSVTVSLSFTPFSSMTVGRAELGGVGPRQGG